MLCEIEEESVRTLGEVTALLKAGMAESSRAARIDEVSDWTAAVDLAWRQLGPGELLVIQSSTISKTVRKIQSLVGLEAADMPRLASA